MRQILITLLFTIFSVVAFGQASISLGVKAGANFANINSDTDTDGITSFHGGAYGLIRLTNIGIQPEVLFSKQGAGATTGDIDLSYVNIPVMFKFYLPAGLNLQAGPQFGILTDAVSNGTNTKDEFKNSDLSAAFGAGWDAPFGLQFTARYVLGLSDVSEAEGDFKNRMFQLSVGYRLFKLGK